LLPFFFGACVFQLSPAAGKDFTGGRGTRLMVNAAGTNVSTRWSPTPPSSTITPHSLPHPATVTTRITHKWQFPQEALEFVNDGSGLLGSGSFGTVRRGNVVSGPYAGQSVAIKCVELGRAKTFSVVQEAEEIKKGTIEFRIEAFMKELKIWMASRSSTHVVTCLGGHVTNGASTSIVVDKERRTVARHTVLFGVLVMELVPQDLRSLLVPLEMEKGGSALHRVDLALQLCGLLSYLQDSMKLSHGDIKTDNILVRRSGELVLADFGMATAMGSLVGRDVIPDAASSRPRPWNAGCPHLHPHARTTLVDESADQYSVMHMLVRLLLGRHSYVSRTLRSTGVYPTTRSAFFDPRPITKTNKCPPDVLLVIQESGFDAFAKRVLIDKHSICLPDLVTSLRLIKSRLELLGSSMRALRYF
jgi:serine/threonine protein kinase